MLEKMKEIIAEQLSVEEDSITEESKFKEDLNADEYSVEIPAEELEKLTTVGDVMNYLKEKGVE